MQNMQLKIKKEKRNRKRNMEINENQSNILAFLAYSKISDQKEKKMKTKEMFQRKKSRELQIERNEREYQKHFCFSTYANNLADMKRREIQKENVIKKKKKGSQLRAQSDLKSRYDDTVKLHSSFQPTPYTVSTTCTQPTTPSCI